MNDRSWAEIVRIVHQRANYCCEYCQTCQKVCGQAMHVEHINPEGGNDLDNLCLACATCNLSKAMATRAHDPLTGDDILLFNPRQQLWADHFEWMDNGAIVHGKSATGRATIMRLKMNMECVVTARRIWIIAGAHPPA